MGWLGSYILAIHLTHLGVTVIAYLQIEKKLEAFVIENDTDMSLYDMTTKISWNRVEKKSGHIFHLQILEWQEYFNICQFLLHQNVLGSWDKLAAHKLAEMKKYIPYMSLP